MQSSIDIHFKNLEPLISHWHSKLETAQKGIPPHITLLWPWKSPPIEPDDIKILKNSLRDTRPFSIQFHQVQYFPNGTIFLACKNIEPLQIIMKNIFETFPECKPYNGEFVNPTPHITIAKVPDQKIFSHVYEDICTALKSKLPLVCPVDEIEIMEEMKTGNWKIIETLKLKK